MYEYIFEGNILPKTQKFPDLKISQHIDNPDLQLEYEMKLEVKNFQFKVIVNTINEFDDFLTLRNSVRESLLLITSIYDYVDACYHDVEILSYTNKQTNQRIELNTSIGNVREKQIGVSFKFEDFYKLFSKPGYNYLRVALLDLNLAIKYPKDTTFFCFRAIESLRKFFSERKSKGWNALYKELRISPSLKQKMEELAKETRHGGPQPLSSEDRLKVLKSSWRIMDRFVLFALNDEKSLDEKFTELKFDNP